MLAWPTSLSAFLPSTALSLWKRNFLSEERYGFCQCRNAERHIKDVGEPHVTPRPEESRGLDDHSTTESVTTLYEFLGAIYSRIVRARRDSVVTSVF